MIGITTAEAVIMHTQTSAARMDPTIIPESSISARNFLIVHRSAKWWIAEEMSLTGKRNTIWAHTPVHEVLIALMLLLSINNFK